jgi:hypothetical protein
MYLVMVVENGRVEYVKAFHTWNLAELTAKDFVAHERGVQIDKTTFWGDKLDWEIYKKVLIPRSDWEFNRMDGSVQVDRNMGWLTSSGSIIIETCDEPEPVFA